MPFMSNRVKHYPKTEDEREKIGIGRVDVPNSETLLGFALKTGKYAPVRDKFPDDSPSSPLWTAKVAIRHDRCERTQNIVNKNKTRKNPNSSAKPSLLIATNFQAKTGLTARVNCSVGGYCEE